MKYVLLALGLLLMLIGGYLVYVGSGIIEIERGWSSVIAGATAFVGGVLTLGLAWIIKTLEQIRAVLETRERAALPRTHDAGEDFADTREMAIAPMAWPPHTAARHDTAGEESGFDDVRTVQAELGPHADSFEPRFYGSAAAEPEAMLPAATRDHPIVAEPTKASPSIKELWRRVAKDIDTRGSASRPAKGQHTEPPPLVAAPPPALPMEYESIPPTEEHGETAAGEDPHEWLDQALLDIDMSLGETPTFTHRADETANEAAEAGPHAEPHLDVQLDEPAPPLPAEPQQRESAAPEDAAVIGRYEAEGTSYIMYADGSIEAQSERGVARFKSMADLKAYFETQDTL